MKGENIVESTTLILNKINILCQEINQVDVSSGVYILHIIPGSGWGMNFKNCSKKTENISCYS